MYAKEVKPLLFYQFGLTGVPGKAPVRHQVVQYHISHVLNPVPEAIFLNSTSYMQGVQIPVVLWLIIGPM